MVFVQNKYKNEQNELSAKVLMTYRMFSLIIDDAKMPGKKFFQALYHRIIVLFRLEKSSKII